ncbi:MAG TPA: heavy metal-binding domain-containing protein [Vicinamibacterales bacterium]|nr:heavy metal-binding domain-containing protein [Vicinamibacterales bacterium]
MSYDPESTKGVPESARERLKQSKAGLFTSDLSVSEFLLVEDVGFDPVGLVMGSSVYHLGFQAPKVGNCELQTLSEAMYAARDLAMTRMEEEADQLGADGIIGVRLEVGRHEWGADMCEFIAIGTAVKHSAGVLHRAPSGRPFTSDLSGQDFWTLIRCGQRPVGLVMGSCVYHVGRRGFIQTTVQMGRNAEMANFTQALYDARELAMGRMQAEAEQAQARGIVGVQIQEHNHTWGSHTVEFFAIGTAVVRAEDPPKSVSPTAVVTLDD